MHLLGTEFNKKYEQSDGPKRATDRFLMEHSFAPLGHRVRSLADKTATQVNTTLFALIMLIFLAAFA